MATYKLNYAPVVQAAFDENERTAELFNCRTIKDINHLVKNKLTDGLVLISEAIQERKFAKAADDIAAHPETKIILIAGPSSSGKTTFTQRLRVQLGTYGIMAMSLSMDNYFVDRVNTPLRPDGSYDFESPKAMDLDLFNRQIDLIAQGAEVETPYYDFRQGKRVYRGDKIHLEKKQVLLVEGIHALNKDLVHFEDEKRVMRVYITVLNPLDRADGTNVNPADVRLIRRIVRDNQYRNLNAMTTLNQWSGVREMEIARIYPSANFADYIVNTSLVYEVNVLKPYVLPLLNDIKDISGEQGELVRHLLGLVDEFEAMPMENIPLTSIMREFIGGSTFKKSL